MNGARLNGVDITGAAIAVVNIRPPCRVVQ